MSADYLSNQAMIFGADNTGNTGDPDIEPLKQEESSASTWQNFPFYEMFRETPTQLRAIKNRLDEVVERTRNIESYLSSLDRRLFPEEEREPLGAAAAFVDPSDETAATDAHSATPSESVLTNLDQETLQVCQKNGLLEYIDLLNDEIHKIYHNVTQIRHRILMLPDMSEHEIVRFEIHLSGAPAQILADEKEFRSIFFEQVPEDKQDFFSFTYSVE